MAQARMLNRSVATDERLNGLSHDAMLLYLLAVPHLDRDGLVDGRPRVLWASVAPLQDEWLTTVGDLIDEWVACGLVVRYGGENQQPVLFFHGFAKNQPRIVYKREQPSRFACPPGYQRLADGLVALDAAPDRDEVATNSRPHHANTEVDDWDARDQVATNSRVGRDEVMTNSRPHYANTEGTDWDARDLVATNSRLGRAEVKDQDQQEVKDQDQDVGGGDLSFPSDSSGIVGKNARARGEKLSAGDMLFAFPEIQLRRGAFELGAGLGLHMKWTGYEQWLARQPASTLVVFMQWCQFYSDLPVEAMKKVHSLTAVIRKNLNDGIHAPLSGMQTLALAELVERVGNLAEA